MRRDTQEDRVVRRVLDLVVRPGRQESQGQVQPPSCKMVGDDKDGHG